ncbi:glyoxalase [Sandaracinobacter neustonicus]|uniref:Glyoxalase n=1 Tax=Sandaracinobacter neustonicus TaxID=1715348 RepID=A0A501XE81_9SPHN|nr:glyoxalase [Sandaracinobacter neustonicus]
MEMTTAQPVRHPSPTVKAERLAFLIFERPDLDRAVRFLVDFGLQVCFRSEEMVLLRGAMQAPYCYRLQRGRTARFIGFGFEVSSSDQLRLLADTVPGASAVEPIPDPAGGRRVVLTDPSGFRVEVVHGQALEPALAHRNPLPLNFNGEAVRIDQTQRPPVQPPEVLRLGHVVLEVADYQQTSGWYCAHLGLIPSDVLLLPDGSPAVAFLRLDLGDQPADHHTLALAQGFAPLYSHSAFEVVDTDAIGMGQRVLHERGWRHAWGVGRHILGSQIFDYWQDAWGDKHEHYCDGDLFTSDRPTGFHPATREAMSQWGQKMPASFTRPKMDLPAVAALVRNVRRSPDLSVRKLITLARLFG